MKQRRPLFFVSSCAVLLGLTFLALPAQADGKRPDGDIAKLSDPAEAEAAVDRLVKSWGKAAVPHLLGEALEGQSMSARGWAIVALSEIGGPDVVKRLDEMRQDPKLPKLVQTWAAAGRIRLATSTSELQRLSSIAAQHPAVARPIALRLIEASGDDPDALGTILELASRHPVLHPALKKAITARGSKGLIKVLVTHSNQSTRRIAASYLGLLASRGDKTVASGVIAAYGFDRKAASVPWKGGPLFLPGIAWSKDDARALVAELVRWVVWSEVHNRADLLRQLHNNLRSIGLANVAGYRPNWSNQSAKGWLTSWKAVVGQAGIDAILKEQGLESDGRFR
ncbi:MAG: hypothetical protein JKY65_29665 [Planctomycetes bacterium]|nr:hypothetical protein [Planctomycetota bacterium]